MTNAFASGLGDIASEVKFDQGTGYSDGQTTAYGGNNPNIWVGLGASLNNDARNSYNPLYNFRTLQINVSITDSSGNPFQLNPTSIATSVWDAPYPTGITVDYAQLIGELSNFLIGLLGVPTPPNIPISQPTPNGFYIVSNTMIAQWTGYPNGCYIDSSFHNTCTGGGGALYDKFLRIKIVPTFTTPDVYKITIGTRVERGGCYQNLSNNDRVLTYYDYCITQETQTQTYSFSYAYENDAGQGSGDAADSLPNAGGNPFFIQHGSYTGLLYGIDTADVYSFSATQGQTLAFTETPPPSADYSLTIFDTTQTTMQKQDRGTGAATGIWFTVSVTGTYFAMISSVSGWGTYSMSLSDSFRTSASPSAVTLGVAGTSSSTSSTITVSATGTFTGTVDFATAITPVVPNGPTALINSATRAALVNPRDCGGYYGGVRHSNYAQVQDNLYADLYDNHQTPSYFFCGYPDPQIPGTISKVEVGAYHYESPATPNPNFDSIALRYAWPNSGSYTTISSMPYSSTYTSIFFDITSLLPSWNSSVISRLGMEYKLSFKYSCGSCYMDSYVDWVPLRITYTSPSVALPIGGSDTRLLTVSSSSSTPPGIYTVNVIGSGGAISFATPVLVAVQDFQVTASPAFLTIPPGQSSSTTIAVSPLNGFTGSVNLFVSAPARFTTGFSTNVISGGSGTSVLTISLTGTPTPDPATITVSGISGGRSQFTTIMVLNPPSDFSVSGNPNPATITAGASNSFTVNVGSLYGFTGSISLTRNAPPGLTCSALSSSTVTLTSTSTSGSSTFSCSAPAGVYSVNVTVTSGTLSHSTIIAITVQDFSMSASPASITVLAGASAASTINIAPFDGFAGTVNLSTSLSPSGLSCSLSPTGIVSSGNSNLSCSGSAGVYTVTVTGTSGTLVHSATVTVTVQDFSISPSASTITVITGQTATSTMNIASLNGFVGTVSLSDSPLPAGLSCSGISSTNVTLPPSPATATLSCTSTAPGAYTVTILASTGSISHGTTVSLSYVGDFSISPNNAMSWTWFAGSWGIPSNSPTATAMNGFNGTVTLTARPSPGLSVNLNPSSIMLTSTSTSGTANWSFYAASAGTYTWTVTASSGTLSHQTPIMTVNIADFAFSVPSSVSVAQGSSATASVTVTALNWWNSAVTLSTSAAPPSASMNLNPTSLSISNGGSASSTLTISPTCHTTLGTYVVTITGTGPQETHSASISVTVTSGAACTPVINTIPNQAVTEKQQLSYQVTGSDPDGDQVTFSLGSAPAGASISSQGLFTWTPADGSDGSYWVLVYVSDTYGGTASQWFLVTVNEADNAQFVSWTTPPAAMIPGQQATVSVTMKNIGSSTWIPDPATNPFRLGSQNPQDNTYWGNVVSIPQAGISASRIELTSSVAPGQQYTFSFTITASTTPGTYNFQWRMVQELIEWFGDYTPNYVVSVSPDIAQFVSWTPPPATMSPGQTANVAVTMKNTGSSTWVPDPATNPFRLGSQNPQDNTYWGNVVSIPQVGISASRIELTSSVAPGQQYTFSFAITAPTAGGNYNFQWRMVHELIRWFGDYTPNVVVTVPGPAVSSCGSISLQTGGYSGSCGITVSSVGGWSGTVNLSLSGGATGGPSATLSPTGVLIAAGGSASAAVSLVSGSSTGYFYFTVTGTSGSQVTSSTFSVYQYVPGGGGGGGSVAAGTLITMADGTQVPVQNVKVGDLVIGYDVFTGKTTVATVTQIKVVTVDTRLTIYTADGLPFRTDANSLFRLHVMMTNGQIILMPVTQIQPGDMLFNYNDMTWVPITKIIVNYNGPQTVYDITTNPLIDFIANGYADCPKACPN